MNKFFSSSIRAVNAKRGITECMESALGDHFSDCTLVIIHASIGHNFQELVDQAHELAPNAKIVASSCCGIVGREGVSESMKDIAIMAVTGEAPKVAGVDGIYSHNSYEKCLEMASKLKAEDPGVRILYFLASGIDINNSECLRALIEVFGNEVSIFGATSSDNMKGVISYQSFDGKVYTNAAYLVGFSDPELGVETQATHGFVAVGEPLIVTKSHGNKILELNGKPAWSHYLNRLGLHENASCGESIPIGALAEELPSALAQEYGNNHILSVVTKQEGDTMYYAKSIPEGTKLWLTARDENRIFEQMEVMTNQMCERLKGKEIVAVFHADCLARGRYLFNKVLKEELVNRMQFPFLKNGECPPWLGMYGFGEFARLGNQNTYHNYTTALYILYKN
ncbi:MAG: FIST C-terminal domain-containing protein [Bacteroidia bacterium]|nr:FIST C-terminal domain-containing protein [Bacteroidia bacterium]